MIILLSTAIQNARASDPIVLAPPFAQLATEYLSDAVLSGFGMAKANGAWAIDSETINNFTYFFGEREIDLEAVVVNENAEGLLNVRMTLTSRKSGEPPLDLSVPIAQPPLPGQKNPQTASVEWEIRASGHVVASDKLNNEASRSAIPDTIPDRVKGATISELGFVPLLPDWNPNTTLFSPNWDYWEPLILGGVNTPADAWADTKDLLSGTDWDAEIRAIAKNHFRIEQMEAVL